MKVEGWLGYGGMSWVLTWKGSSTAALEDSCILVLHECYSSLYVVICLFYFTPGSPSSNCFIISIILHNNAAQEVGNSDPLCQQPSLLSYLMSSV